MIILGYFVKYYREKDISKDSRGYNREGYMIKYIYFDLWEGLSDP